MFFTQPRLLPALGIALIWLSGCATTQKRMYTPEEINSVLDARMSAQMRNEIVIPFEIDDEIRQLAHDVTARATTDREKMRALVHEIISLAGFSISYDWLSNKTAKEVFRQGKGNCLAYSNLFVGMAREVGLQVVYADVTSVERVSREAEIIVNSNHVTAAVMRGPSTILIDFTSKPEREYTGYRLIDDLEAIAHFYNNQGFLYGYFTETGSGDLGFDPLEKELEMYNLSLEVLPTFQRARNNLGVALRRRGKVDEAIEQYKIAIEDDPRFAEARSNLGTAYMRQGRTDEALEQYELAAKDSGPNGFIHHRLGVVYLRLARYQEAIKQFRKALSKESDLADAHYYLGECYRKLGDEKKAIKEFEEALVLDPNYLPARTKLDSLSPSDKPQQ
jgi:tetratricopeptide (TPR) repeat protein